MRLTLKQKQFVKKYIEHKGNGTKAALEVYDTSDSNVAHAIASENLQKPTIKRAIELSLERVGLNDDYISEILKEATVAGIGQKPTNADTLRGIDMMLKLKDAYPNKMQTSAHFRLERKEEVQKLSYQELKTKMKELQESTNKLLQDCGIEL